MPYGRRACLVAVGPLRHFATAVQKSVALNASQDVLSQNRECIDPPFFDDLARLVEVGKQVFVETFVTQAAVEVT